MLPNRTQPSNTHYALIMAGGEGTRFAPLSTPEKPKQFLSLLHPTRTLLQQTYDRLLSFCPPENILVATNGRYLPLVQEQLPQMKPSQIFGETRKKNTAPCLAWVSFQLFRKNRDTLLLAIPSDQFITPEPLFKETMLGAFQTAKEHDAIVTIGIRPTFASTHHGYLQRAPKPLDGKTRCFRVERFIEKPDAVLARRFLEDGNYFWNGGTFVFPVAKMMAALEADLPALFSLLKPAATLPEFFERAPAISIDYGIMEKRKDLLMAEAPFTWSDVGTWESLADLAEQHALNLPPEVTRQLRQK